MEILRNYPMGAHAAVLSMEKTIDCFSISSDVLHHSVQGVVRTLKVDPLYKLILAVATGEGLCK